MAFDQTDLRNSRLAIAPATADEDAVRLDQIMPGPVVGIVINLITVVSIVAPAELANYNGKDAAIIICKQRGNPDLSAIYVFDESCTNAANARTIVTAKADPDYTAPKWIAGANYNLLGECNQEGNHIPLADNTYDIGRTSGGNLRWKTINALAGVFGSTLSVASTSNFGDTMTAQAINAAALQCSTLNASGIVTFSGNPRCVVYRSTTQTIPDSAATIVRFLTERSDVGGYYNNSDVAGTGGKYTIGAGGGGTYQVEAHVNWVYNATGQRNIGIFVNSTEWHHDQILPANGGGGQSKGGNVDVVAGDVISVQVLQNSGGNLDIDPTSNANSNITLSIAKVG